MRGALAVFLTATVIAPALRAEPLPQLEWHTDAAEVCLLTPDKAPVTPAQERLAGLLAALPPDMPLAGILAEEGIALCLEDRASEARGAYLPDAKLVYLGARLGEDRMLAIFLHELRHVDQIARGYCPALDLKMGDYARAIMAMEADAQAIASLLAWQLREGGAPGAWDALLDMPETSDISEAFSAEMSRSDDISLATGAAFDQWFASADRVETYYRASCSAYLDALDKEHLLPSYNALPSDHLVQLCVLPDGSPYPCEETR